MLEHVLWTIIIALAAFVLGMLCQDAQMFGQSMFEEWTVMQMQLLACVLCVVILLCFLLIVRGKYHH